VGPRSGLDTVEYRIIFLLPGIEHWLSSPEPVAIPIELSRLPLLIGGFPNVCSLFHVFMTIN
jgi:hypothetical protein